MIARVHGSAFAGGVGLAAACDIVVAEPTAEFCLSEVRIGFVHELSQDGAIDQAVARITGALLDAGPQAVAQTRALIEQVGTRQPLAHAGRSAYFTAKIRVLDPEMPGYAE